MRQILFLVALSALVSVQCNKMQTATCTCKTPWGDISTRQTKSTNDKDEMAKWRQDCRNDGNTYHTTSTTGTVSSTTSTYVPCELE